VLNAPSVGKGKSGSAAWQAKSFSGMPEGASTISATIPCEYAAGSAALLEPVRERSVVRASDSTF
jgi:hypothetical protein